MATELNKPFPAYKPKGKEEYMNPRQLGHFEGLTVTIVTAEDDDVVIGALSQRSEGERRPASV